MDAFGLRLRICLPQPRASTRIASTHHRLAERSGSVCDAQQRGTPASRSFLAKRTWLSALRGYLRARRFDRDDAGDWASKHRGSRAGVESEIDDALG